MLLMSVTGMRVTLDCVVSTALYPQTVLEARGAGAVLP